MQRNDKSKPNTTEYETNKPNANASKPSSAGTFFSRPDTSSSTQSNAGAKPANNFVVKSPWNY